MSRIVLVGLSGNTLELLDLITASFEIAAILSDNPDHAPIFEGIEVTPLSNAGEPRFSDCQFLFLIGSEKSYTKRSDMIARMGIKDRRFTTLTDPRATVSSRAKVGLGCVLSTGVTIMAQAKIGDHVLILPQSIIHHDSQIGRCSIVGSHVTIAGNVTVGPSCYIGSASAIRNGITIGEGALIGMGANVVRDVAPGAIMVGNPARPLATRDHSASGRD